MGRIDPIETLGTSPVSALEIDCGLPLHQVSSSLAPDARNLFTQWPAGQRRGLSVAAPRRGTRTQRTGAPIAPAPARRRRSGSRACDQRGPN